MNDYHETSKIIGIRPSMEYESGSGDYFLHVMYLQESKMVYYMRISPTNTANAVA